MASFNTWLTRKNVCFFLKLGEIIGNMATFALLAKPAIVNIPVSMATPTCKRHVKFLFHRLFMTIQTAGFQVGAIKLVLGAAIMVKVP